MAGCLSIFGLTRRVRAAGWGSLFNFGRIPGRQIAKGRAILTLAKTLRGGNHEPRVSRRAGADRFCPRTRTAAA